MLAKISSGHFNFRSITQLTSRCNKKCIYLQPAGFKHILTSPEQKYLLIIVAWLEIKLSADVRHLDINSDFFCSSVACRINDVTAITI